jgi:hypothetical protein
MILLNRNTIKMQRMLWVDMEDVIGLGFVFAFLISYGLSRNTKKWLIRWLMFDTRQGLVGVINVRVF